ncbi:hypothetical protein L208DRAFT_1400542 [Tricholoma matsutake]|nr:hypothetical protein L208DRAFT_1400542 [Tricholoma matsutake 945]
MASHSPQRARRPPHPVTGVSVHSLRETSRSPAPRERPRTLKAQSMPIVPSAIQVFAAGNQNTQPSQQSQQQPSPTSSINSRRSPPASMQVQRLLPTPPQPNPMINRDESPDRDMSPPLPPQHQSPPNPHYPRPINRAPPQFLTKYQDINLQMNDILAEIERTDYTDVQQSQAHVSNNSASAYPGYPRGQSNSPPRDPAVERVRATERSSPKEVDAGQQRRQQALRESPKVRDRQQNSPTAAPFAQAPIQQSSEQAVSTPYQNPLAPPGEHHSSSGYAPRESPPVARRTANATVADNRLPRPAQTPPLQAITARTPDRSLPVQEEPEDDPGAPSKHDVDTREVWQGGDQAHHEHHSASPTPSSDLSPEGEYDGNHPHGGRVSRTGHHDDNGPVMKHEEGGQLRYSDREDEESYTPRSLAAGLPDQHREDYYGPQNVNVKGSQTVRGRGRNGTSDQLGLRSFDPAVFEQDQQMLPMGSEHPIPKYVERRPTQNGQQQHQQQQHYQPQNQNQRFHEPRPSSNQANEAQYRPQAHPDDFQNYSDDLASAYLQSYIQSARPDAPIPPTPHSQTAAPSPSPLILGGHGAKALHPFSPVAPVGSPYPYPYSHVRRVQPTSGHPNGAQLPSNSIHDPNHPSVIQEQLVRQWQIYAMNNDHGNISDSTFSPSSTPFQGYNPWAFLHTSRMLGGRGRMHDTTMSLQSSPSHEPIALPTPPPMLPKKKSPQNGLRRHLANRKLPPRVESTQPRETSPELSSSGEETAGEEHLAVAEEGNWVNGAVTILPADDSKDWIDEDEDEDDLLELEYHPGYVSNVEKRRRRWEIGWENLTQAFQALDRQTDATMVLLAAPSHSTKLYSLKSRAIRRQAVPVNTASMKELRTGFSRIASQRRNTRTHKSSIVERFMLPTGGSGGDGSDGSSESREEDLKRALEAALGSLGALGGIYEQREARWIEEMRRISEDREKVELLLKQVLGEGHLFSPGSSSTTNVSHTA